MSTTLRSYSGFKDYRPKPRRPWWLLWLACGCAIIALVVVNRHRFPGSAALIQRLRGQSTVADRLAQYGPPARRRLEPFFKKAGVTYPPHKLILVGFKQEKDLELYAANADDKWRYVQHYNILGLSGHTGPKLHENDMQVPEGFYRIESLHPNSAFHLALHLNYPNQADLARAAKEGRTGLGGDIMIHGSNGSAGCLAMGDKAAEDLFVLAADTGSEKIQIILSPVDFRVNDVAANAAAPPWVPALYDHLRAAVVKLPGNYSS